MVVNVVSQGHVEEESHFMAWEHRKRVKHWGDYMNGPSLRERFSVICIHNLYVVFLIFLMPGSRLGIVKKVVKLCYLCT